MFPGRWWVTTAMAWALIWALVWALLGAGPAVARSQAELARDLPRHYLGTFQWDGQDQAQQVELEFQSVREMKNGRLTAAGPGMYTVGERMTRITFQAVIDPADLGIELIEQDASREKFETDGAHRGRLSDDLQEIRARWTTRRTGKSGVLILRASEREPGE